MTGMAGPPARDRGHGRAAGSRGVLMGSRGAGIDRDRAVVLVDRLRDHPHLRHQRGRGAVARPARDLTRATADQVEKRVPIRVSG
ncbi:hypothetical protein GCM10009634_19850 [Saccharothrix xinjiangensis]